jgi:hypothetical protein
MIDRSEWFVRNSFYQETTRCALKVKKKMPTIIGLVFVGLVIRAILGAAIVVTVVLLAWKLGKLADAYTHKLTTTQ